MYIVKTPPDVPNCNLSARPRALGDSQTPSFLASAGVSGNVLLIGGAALLAGWMLNSFVTSTKKSIRRKRVALRKRSQQIGSALSTPTPTWQVLLLVALAGGAVYYFTTRSGKVQA